MKGGSTGSARELTTYGVIAVVAVVLLSWPAGSAFAQTPALNVTGLPAMPLIGEETCATLEFSNTAPVEGYGPYVFVTLDPEVTVTANTFLGIQPPVEQVGPIDETGMITDPISGMVVAGPPGGNAAIVRYPVGSVVQGQPPLVLEACAVVQVGAEIDVPLDVNFLPGFEFGDTPTGDNGPVTGASSSGEITPQLARVTKTANVPEGERPPGPDNAFSYSYVLDASQGVPLTDVVLTDDLPAEIQWTGGPISVTGPLSACQVTTEPNLPPTPDGMLVVECAGVIGTAGENDLTVSLPVYITDILDETGPDSQAIGNTVVLEYSYQDMPFTNSDDATLTAKHVAVQKGASPGVAVPGDVITYSVNFQVTDYPGGESLTSLVLEDVLADGLLFIDNSTLSLDGADTPITPTVTAGPGAGETTVDFDIAQAAGGQVALGVHGTLSYQAEVLEAFDDGTEIVASDGLGNAVDLAYTHSQGASDSDGSSANVVITPTEPRKMVVAPTPLPDPLAPGDTITFRVELDIPSEDTLSISMTDFMPLPVVFVADIDPATDITVPDLPGISDVEPVYSADTAANSFTLTWPDPGGLGFDLVAADITVTITDIPFADGLFLTNLLQTTTVNNAGEQDVDTIARGFNVGAPDVFVTKGVLSVDNTAAIIDPPPPADPAQALADSDAVDVDAGDVVEYVITAENRGSQSAWNITVTDPPVAGLDCAPLVMGDVTDGTGETIPFTGDSLQDGIVVDGPLEGNDGEPEGGGAPFGADTLLIRQSCTVETGAVSGETLTNTVTMTFTPTSGTSNAFPERSDAASVTLAQPTVAKSIISVTPGYTGNPQRVHIGEIIAYEVTVTVPEGTSPDVQFDDVLDPGLAFVALDGITASSGLTTSVGSFDPGVIGNAAIIAQGSGDANLDRRLLIGPGSGDFGFGDVVNSDTDNGTAETITLSYRARVLNTTGNTRGVQINNRALWSWAANGQRRSVQASAPNVRIVEPGIDVTKAFVPDTADAGNPSTVQIRVRHSGASDATAYQLALDDVWPTGVTPDASTLTTINCNLEPNVLVTSTGQLTAGWASFPVGSDCTIQVDTTGQPPLPAGSTVDNCALGRWTSLDNADLPLPMPPANPLGVQRTGDASDPGGAANTYFDEGCALLKIFDVGISKTVASSTQAHTMANGGVEELAVGEEVTFLLTATLPEAPTVDLVIEDSLPSSAMVLEVLSAEVLQLSDNTNLTVPGFPPMPSLEDRALGDGLDDTVVVAFGSPILNASDGEVNENDRIQVLVTAVVNDLPINQNQTEDINVARVTFGDQLNATDSADLRVVEPLLSLTKTGDLTSVEAGDTVNYTLSVTHQGGSRENAFDVMLMDELPPELELVAGSVALGDNCPNEPDSGPTGAGNTITAAWAAFPLGAACDIVFAATISIDAISGSTITNQSDIVWTSLDDTAPSNAEERSYTDDAQWEIVVGDPGLTKTQIDSDIADTQGQQLTIGEIVTFELVAEFPDGTTEDVSVGDVLPSSDVAFELLSSEVTAIGADLAIAGGLAVGDPGDVCQPDCDTGDQGFDDTALWELGEVINEPNAGAGSGPDDRVTFEIQAIVRDLPVNQGIPSGPDQVYNRAALDSANLLSQDQAPVTVVEPRLELEHFIDPDQHLDVVAAGEMVDITLNINHLPESSAPAFGLVVDYMLDADVVWVGDATVSSNCPGLVVDSSAATPAPGTIEFSFDELPLALGTCSIDFQLQMSPTLPVPGVAVDNSTLVWESAPGSTDSRAGQDARFVTYLAPGDGEITKRLDTTSVQATGTGEGDPLLQDVTIGETVSYQLVAGVAEGETGTFMIEDTLPAGLLAIEAATVVSIGGNISTSLPGTPVLAGAPPNAVTFDFGTVTNTADGVADQDDIIIVGITARLLDDPANADGGTLTNGAVLTLPAGTRTAEASIDIVEPVLGLDKQMAEPEGGRVPITLTVRNDGTAPAYSADVSDVFDESIWVAGNLEPISVPTGWTLDAASAGGQTTVTFATDGDPAQPMPSQVILPGGSRTAQFYMSLVTPVTDTTVDNTADATANSLPAQDPAARETTADAEDGLSLPALDSDKSWTGPGNPAVPGDLLTYTVEITNSGAAAANDVVVTDMPDPLGELQPGSVSTATGTVISGNLPGDSAVVVQFATIGAGETASFSYDVLVPLPYPADEPEQFVNQAVISSRELPDFDSNDPATDPDDDPTIVPIVADPVMDIVKDDLSEVVGAGGTVFYEVTYSNIGNQDATGVVITDAVPPNTTFNAAGSTPGWSCADGSGPGTVCSFEVGPLGAGQGDTIFFAVTVDDPLPPEVTEIANTAFITDDGENSGGVPSTDQDDDTTLVLAAPVLDITKDDGGVSTAPGGTVVYQIDYVNNGGQDATGVRLADTVPDNTVFDAAASQPYAWSCPDGSPPGTVCILNVGDLEGEGIGSGTANFAVRVDPALPAGVVQLDNVVLIADDGASTLGFPVVALALDDTPIVGAQPDLVIDKVDSGVIGRPGTVIPYTLNYQQVGNQDATGVVITETVPTGTTFSAADSLPDVWSCADSSPPGTTCTLAVGALPVGASGTARFALLVDDPLPPGLSEVVNTVTIADDGTNGPDPTPANNTDSESTLVTLFRPAGFKQARQTRPDNVAWRMVWFNNLNTTDLPVSIHDPMPTNAHFVPGSLVCLATGDSQCLSASYNAAEDRIEVEAVIAPDFGAPNDATTDQLDNEVVVRFATDVAQTGSFENVADACWDENNSGTATDDRDMGQTCVPAEAAIRAVIPVPALGALALALMALLLAAAGIRYARPPVR